MKNKNILPLAISIIVGLVIWFLPAHVFGIENLSVIEQRVIALFCFAAIMWITEAVPIWATSVLIIVIMLLTISDNSIWFMRVAEGFDYGRPFGQTIQYQALMATFADPIIMLFLGGFILAIGAGKCGLDNNLARVMFKPFGTNSNTVLLGLMLITATFSMFMSNTATTAMMFAVMAPLLAPMDKSEKGRIALILAIPVAANIGGLGTPIGTPPNAIALKYLNDPNGLNLGIGFGQWMTFMVPYVYAMIFLSWLFMIKLFPFSKKQVKLNFDGKFEKSPKAYIIYATFAVTILLWMFDKLTGLNANIVAMIPIAVFGITGIITKEDLKHISWDVLWLVAGGFALGVALETTGLAKNLVYSIPFAQWQPIVTIVGAGLLCYTMSTFMSNTATAALLIPVLTAVAVGMGDSILAYGGVTTLLMGVAISSSVAMALPISTPPNAIALATGLIMQRDMLKIGLLVGVVGLAIGYIMLFVLGCGGAF